MEFLNKENEKEFNEFVDNCEKGHFLQTTMWAKVKNTWAYEGVISRGEDNKIKGAMLILIRKMRPFPYSLLYSPRGPVCDINDEETLKELFDGAKKIAEKHNGYELRLDPDVKKDEENFGKICKKLGFSIKNDDKNYEGIQPRFVFRLDIGDKDEEQLLEYFSSKTRYNIRLSIKKGVTVKRCGKEALDDFTRIMRETGERDNFSIRSKDYFERILDNFGKDSMLAMAYFEDKPIAGILPVRYAGKVWYVYGASSNEYRNVMPNYQLQWEMIKWAKENSCKIYDFRGVAGFLDFNEKVNGLYRFKKGFNGEFTEFIGELEYVYKPFAKKLIHFAEKSYKALKMLQKKFRKLKNGK
ncbi:MAG: peptidoglycan bridge formation glycyltransferase FemA/FemB family protein [Clostridia bacterium]|nr:peptidoglycan bridge formation glycyltransferase FemA/FemB family protein [Clostridia bacterium]